MTQEIQQEETITMLHEREQLLISLLREARVTEQKLRDNIADLELKNMELRVMLNEYQIKDETRPVFE